ncbi:MAG TPA: CBS domain-containing protein [Phycisphaerales bacterium]|nr:CBS domain-containing protein [Phycisphaerales bacterium]
MNETKTIMTTNVVTVKSDTPIDRALELLIEKNITGLPVVDDDRTLIGIISEKDMLKLLPDLEDESATVADFMTKKITCFDQDEDLIAICECLMNNNFRRVPIVSNGKLVGVISRRDIIKYIIEPIG